MKLSLPCLHAEMEDAMKEICSQYRADAMRKEEFRVGEWKGSNLDFEGFDFVG